MQQIRGIKVKPDSAEGTPSNGTGVPADDKHINSSHPRQSGSSALSNADRPKAADKNALKKPDKKEVAKDTATKTATTAVLPQADQHSSKNAVVNGNVGKASKPTATTDTTTAASVSLDKQTVNELLRTCARCNKSESTVHEFKKCKK